MANVESSGEVKLGASFASPSGKTTLTDIEVANRLGVSRFTVRSWRLKGVGPRFLKMGRAVRYRPQDVDDYERQALVERRQYPITPNVIVPAPSPLARRPQFI